MNYKLSNEADKFLKNKYKKDNPLYNRLMKKIDEIIKNPSSFECLSKKGNWQKARVGKYRIIFTVISDNDNEYCFIVLIGLRNSIYKMFNRKYME